MPETKTLTHYQNLKYPIEIFEDDDAFVASIPDLPGCVAYGDTVQEALDSLRSVKKLWLEGRLRGGLSVPEPSDLEEYSGKFVLRITRGLHKSLQREAQRQGVSLNQYIGQILAERHKLIDLDQTVENAVRKCLVRADPSCASVWAYWSSEEARTHISDVSKVSVLNDKFPESFVALFGEKQPKSYQLPFKSEPYSDVKWTSDAQKKTKAHAHHC